ncbi:phage repressor protein CI [Rahnella aceris]|uniref:phage repressor protein CI n=1 Tax=Rahnella sp. (strain Y9602) TaxID=2703885 RepID=UPI003FD15C64
MDFKTGGQKVILRLVEAYGFSTRQMLCDHLGVSKSTLATRFMRDIFPAEWVIQCALETGASLRWLTFGVGAMFDNTQNDILKVPKKKISNGAFLDAGFYYFDKALLDTNIVEPIVVIDCENTYISDKKFIDIVDGLWLVSIEGTFSIRNIFRLPNNKFRVQSDKFSFETESNNVDFILHLQTVIKRLK